MIKTIEDFKNKISQKYTGKDWYDVDWRSENEFINSLGMAAEELYLNEAIEELVEYNSNLAYELGWLDGNAGMELVNPFEYEDRN